MTVLPTLFGIASNLSRLSVTCCVIRARVKRNSGMRGGENLPARLQKENPGNRFGCRVFSLGI